MLAIAVAAVAACQSFGHGPGEEGHAPLEARLLPEAEENLAVGNARGGADLYRRAFQAASDFEERLALMAPLTRSLFVNEDLAELLGAPRGVSATLDDWEETVLHAAALQLLQDLSAAGEQLLGIAPDAAPAEYWRLLRRQAAAWAEEAGDADAAINLAREAFRDEPTRENHERYLRALIEAGAADELGEHIEARLEHLPAEAGLWRSLLPDLSRHGLLDPIAAHLEQGWQEEIDDAAVAFALGELRVFQGEIDEAAKLFWIIFEMEEAARPADGIPYFQRLNHFFHNRYTVKNRLGQATGRYGSEMCRKFLFLGLREDFNLVDIGAARDAALLYLRELSLGTEESADFLRRVGIALDRADRSPGQRILAFAGLAAPAWLLDEIDAFMQSPVRDTAAAEFSLLAMNRYVLSTEKFPELRERMGELASGMAAKLSEAPVAVQHRSEQMQAQVLRRLGLDDVPEQEVTGEPGSQEDYYGRIMRAAQEGDPEEAERFYRELVVKEDGRNETPQHALLFLARAWREQSTGRAAALIAEYLEPFYGRQSGQRGEAPVRWPDSGQFPPPNPYLTQGDLEILYEAFDGVAGTPVWDALKETLAERHQTLPEELKPGACAVQMTLHWWAGEPEQAAAAGYSCDRTIEEPELKLLLAHLLGLQEKFEEASKLLEEISPEATAGAEHARRLLFAFSVASQDAERAAICARELSAVPLSGPEKLRVAFGLSEVGLVAEADEWVQTVALDEIEPDDEKLYQRVWLQVRLHRGENERAAGVARFVLMQAIPEGFAAEFEPGRLEALEALEALDQLESYREQLRQLLVHAPQALSVHLLLGESADFRWQRASAASAKERDASREEAVSSYRRAADLRPSDGEMQLQLCEWLVERELWPEAVARYQELLEVDAQSALLDTQTLFEAYRRAGELPLLVDFLEEWQAPEAVSMDDFYGLQPTEHLFRPLGEVLLKEEEREAAVRAWEKGLRINPIAFTEQMRLALAAVYAEAGEKEKLLEVLRSYVSQENVDPHFYAVQPFASVVPRWVVMLNNSADPAAAPVEKLIGLAMTSGRGDRLQASAEEWRAEAPERLSTAVFSVYMSARSGAPGWQGQFAELKNSFAAEGGPSKGAWEAVEALFARF